MAHRYIGKLKYIAKVDAGGRKRQFWIFEGPKSADVMTSV